jgi:uncharacterized protein involved in exopolysaccharide biosynthesis
MPAQKTAFEGEVSMLELVNILLRRWRAVICVPLLAVALVLGVSFVMPPTYTAVTSFVPEARPPGRLPAGLAGLAGQFGISVGTDASQSPRFYAEVARSSEILDRLVLARYADPRTHDQLRDSTTLLRILRKGGRNGADSLQQAAKTLARLISTDVNTQTGIVTVKTESRYPDLAAAVANRLVAYLNEFNAQTRQSQARERRRFIEQRAADGERDLHDTEEALKRFYQANRSWQQSPQLVFEEGRLRRQVELRQELYLTLRREYETARIEEVNDTPVITVIDSAAVPQRKSSPKHTLWAVLALVASGMVAVSWAFGAEYFSRLRAIDDAVYREFRKLLRQLSHQTAETVQTRPRTD